MTNQFKKLLDLATAYLIQDYFVMDRIKTHNGRVLSTYGWRCVHSEKKLESAQKAYDDAYNRFENKAISLGAQLDPDAGNLTMSKQVEDELATCNETVNVARTEGVWLSYKNLHSLDCGLYEHCMGVSYDKADFDRRWEANQKYWDAQNESPSVKIPMKKMS